MIGVPVGQDADSLLRCLGVLAAGLTVFPFDRDQPEARALTQQRTAGSWALLDESGAVRIPETPPDGRAARGGAGPAAYVLGTSGTTGEPKIVVIPTTAAERYACGLLDRLGRPRRVSSLLFQPLSVDLGYTSVIASLGTGGTLHILTGDESRDPVASRAYVAAHGIDLVKITPSHLRALQQGDVTALVPRRYLILGGEPLPGGYARDLALANAGCRVYNHYGPSETAVGVAMHQVAATAAPGGDQATVSLGSALGGIRLTVSDDGELLIAGAGLDGGYLSNPRETAARFVPVAHPDAPPGSRAFRSGDIITRDDAGLPYFQRRLDSQVKLHGHRVDLGEVEAALRGVAGVYAAAATVTEDERLVAAVQADSSFDPHLASRHLGQALPSYMLPRSIEIVSELPRTGSGKVDRRRVAELVHGAPESGAERLRPPEAGPDPLTGRIQSVLADVLEVAHLAADADFFDSGGDSLLAMTVVWQMRIDMGIDISLADLVEARSAAGIARLHAARPS